MVPSGLVNSHSTPQGESPARQARSTTASACSGRFSSPPGRAFKGKTWPGFRRSPGRAPLVAAALTVATLSEAETPVVTPLAASKVVLVFPILAVHHKDVLSAPKGVRSFFDFVEGVFRHGSRVLIHGNALHCCGLPEPGGQASAASVGQTQKSAEVFTPGALFQFRPIRPNA